MKFILFISKRFLSEQSRQKGLISFITLTSIIGVLLGVMVPILVISIMNGLQTEMKTKILGVNGHLSVISSATSSISNYQETKKRILQEENVEAVNSIIELQGLLNIGNTVEPVLIKGIEQKIFDEDKSFGKVFKITSGTNDVNKRYYALIGQEIAEKHFLFPGDRLSVTAILDSNESKTIQIYVSGVFKTGYYQYDASSIYISLVTLQKAFELQGKIKNFDIKTKDIWKTKILQRILRTEYSQFLHVFSWQELNENLFKALASEKILLSVVMLFILLVAVFNIMSTQIMLVIDKKKTIAILKVLGVPTHKILQIFLLEGLLTTSIGAILGAFFGVVIAKNINRGIQFIESIVNFFIGIYYEIFFWFSKSDFLSVPTFSIFPEGVYYLDELKPYISFVEIGLIIFLALFLALVSGLVPAFKAAKLKPLSIIRYE